MLIGFRVVLFWTELKLRSLLELCHSRFRVVLFWTELKQFMILEELN